MRVLIVGAGPTGLTTAVELARRGISARVIDRKDEGSTLSRAVGILPRSLKLLLAAGVTDQLLAEGIKMRKARIYREQRRQLTIPLQGMHDQYDFVLALAQDRTEAALRDALVRLGGNVTYGTTFLGLEQDSDRVIARTNQSEEEAFDYVVGADGSRSAVREVLGIDFVGHDLPKTWSIADVDAANWRHPDAFTICLTGSGEVVVVAPLEAERFRVISNTESSLETLPLPLDVTNIRREGQFNISVRQVSAYAQGRVYLAGDAAHCHSPVGGRGMNLGISDAAELASRLVEGRLAGYSDDRHAVGAETIALSERGRRVVTSENPLTRTAAITAMRLIDNLPPLKKRLASVMLNG